MKKSNKPKRNKRMGNAAKPINNQSKPIDNQSNWLTEYLVLVTWFIFAISVIIISITVNGSINPLKWGVRSVFVVTAVLAMTIWMILIYLEQQKKLSVLECIKTKFNLDEYTDPPKKTLDVILTHYTNVATIGLFLALAVYSTRPLVKYCAAVGGFILTILVLLAFFIYALFLLRLANRFVNSKNLLLYLFIVTAIFIVDSKAVEMLIKGTPQTGMEDKKREACQDKFTESEIKSECT